MQNSERFMDAVGPLLVDMALDEMADDLEYIQRQILVIDSDIRTLEGSISFVKAGHTKVDDAKGWEVLFGGPLTGLQMRLGVLQEHLAG